MFPRSTTVIPGVDEDELGGVPVERLEAELCQLAAQSAAAMCRWLLLLAEFDRRDGANTWGMASTATWIAWRCGVDSRTARDHVRVAKALAGLPVISAAFASGELPYSKVRALTRIATAEHESELLDFARAATTDQLERSIRAWRQAVRDVGEDGDGEASEVHPSWTDDGFGDLRARLTPEDAALVFAALDAEAERLAQEELREGGSAEPPSPRSVPVSPLSERRASALVAMAEQYLHDRSAAVPDDRFLVIVHADAETGTGHLDNGPGLDRASLEAIMCDQPYAVLAEDGHGNPLFLGRTTRTVTRVMRRALHVRDGGRCRFPGCTTAVGLHGHHVRWWERDLGPTDITNLALLCRRHHRLIHRGAFTITSDGHGGFVFTRTDGTEIERSPASPRASVTVEDANAAAGAEVVGAPAGGSGERLSLTWAVDGLMSRARAS